MTFSRYYVSLLALKYQFLFYLFCVVYDVAQYTFSFPGHGEYFRKILSYPYKKERIKHIINTEVSK